MSTPRSSWNSLQVTGSFKTRVRPAVRDLGLDVKVKVVAEGAGALAYATLQPLPPEPGAVATVSGGNISSALLRELLADG